MDGGSYWLNIFDAETWQEFANAGSTVSGFRKEKWSTVQKIKPGDLLLCYLSPRGEVGGRFGGYFRAVFRF